MTFLTRTSEVDIFQIVNAIKQEISYSLLSETEYPVEVLQASEISAGHAIGNGLDNSGQNLFGFTFDLHNNDNGMVIEGMLELGFGGATERQIAFQLQVSEQLTEDQFEMINRNLFPLFTTGGMTSSPEEFFNGFLEEGNGENAEGEGNAEGETNGEGDQDSDSGENENDGNGDNDSQDDNDDQEEIILIQEQADANLPGLLLVDNSGNEETDELSTYIMHPRTGKKKKINSTSINIPSLNAASRLREVMLTEGDTSVEFEDGILDTNTITIEKVGDTVTLVSNDDIMRFKTSDETDLYKIDAYIKYKSINETNIVKSKEVPLSALQYERIIEQEDEIPEDANVIDMDMENRLVPSETPINYNHRFEELRQEAIRNYGRTFTPEQIEAVKKLADEAGLNEFKASLGLN